MNSSKRILIFSLAYYPVEGGAEIAVKEITDRLGGARLPTTEVIDNGGQVEFDLVTKRFDKSHQSFERVGNVNVYRINSSKILFPLKAHFFAKKLQRQKTYDTVWSIMAAYAGLAGLFFKSEFPETKFVLTLQEGDSLEHIKSRMSFLEPLFKKVFEKADIVQTISNFLADWARSMGARNVLVIPNGVDFEKFQETRNKIQTNSKFEIQNSQINLITTSRLVEKNAVGDIIESLKYLPENVSLKILGTGPLESELKIQTKNQKLEDRVEFLGHVDYGEIPRYLNESDIFIRPSLSEGFGNSFIEAMAAGLPVIATPVGGIVDFLKDGSTGLFCEVHNPESIAKQVERLIADGSLKKSLIANASKMVKENYEWDLIANEMQSKVFGKI